MTQPIATVVRVAATPEQAKILVAQLQGAGIPAFVEGDSLADEVAVSRRLMNLGGTRIMVPTASLARAQEVLAAVSVGPGELEAQALAAPAPETPPSPRVAAPRGTPWWSIGATLAALLFLLLWLGEVEARAAERSPFVRHEVTPNGLREIRIADGEVLADLLDQDRDGHFEEIRYPSRSGRRSVMYDAGRDHRYERLEEYREGLVFRWMDADHDGFHDGCTVEDAAGKVLQELRYVQDKGFVVEPR